MSLATKVSKKMTIARSFEQINGLSSSVGARAPIRLYHAIQISTQQRYPSLLLLSPHTHANSAKHKGRPAARVADNCVFLGI